MPKKRNAKRADGRIAVQVYLGRDETASGNTKPSMAPRRRRLTKKRWP